MDLFHDLLPSAESDRILAHVAVCARCATYFREWVVQRERLVATRALSRSPEGDLLLERPEERIRRGERRGGGLWDVLSQRWTEFLEGFRRPRLEPSGGWAGSALVRRRGFQVAAGLVAVTAIILLVLWPPSVAPPLIQLTDIRVMRGDMHDGLARALSAYYSEDYELAADLLSSGELHDLGGEWESVRKIYLGSALGLWGKYQEAVAVLETIPAEEVPEPWRGEMRWTLYIALEESGHGTRANSLLTNLAKESGRVGELAREVLQQQERK